MNNINGTVRLADFVENPDNPRKIDAEAFKRLCDKLVKAPEGLTAMRIAYVTDHSAGRFVVISGNTRLRALKTLRGEDGTAPAAWFQDVTAMDEEQRRAFIVAANNSDGEWDVERLLSQYDKDELGELLNADTLDKMLTDLTRGEDAAEIETDETDESRQFEEKFVPKRTTDDCYTPENIYAEVLDWAAARYGFDKGKVVRPFYPGGDYQAAEYPDGFTVVDNPPFSIFSEIIKFYCKRQIPFFLFGPSLTLSPYSSSSLPVTYIVVNATITYANGAVVNTSFITNMDPEAVIYVAGDLCKRLEAIDAINRKECTKDTKKHLYPMSVVSCALLGKIASRGIELRISRDDAYFVRMLDEQKKSGDGIFGGGFIISERAAAERAAAERAAAERAAAERAAAERAAAERAAASTWKLSPRELKIQSELGKGAAK
jgi:hypothetical protein